MTQQQINSTMGFLWVITIVWFGFLITASNWQYHYEWETRNRLMNLEEQVRFQVERVSRIDNNLYHKVMTDTESDYVKQSHRLLEDVTQLDTMFYSFENEWVIFSYNKTVTGEEAYIYVDLTRKVIVKDYKPKF